MAACKFPFFTLVVCTWSDALAFLGDHLFAKCPGQPASFVGMKYVFDGQVSKIVSQSHSLLLEWGTKMLLYYQCKTNTT